MPAPLVESLGDGPGLGVVVVAYGPVEPLRRCLATLDPSAVVVVDNGRSDECRAVVDDRGATYLRAAENRGFAGGVNLGVEHVKAGLDVLLLNPDAHLGWAEATRLHAALRADPGLAAVAPVLHRPDGSLEPVRWPIPTPAATAWDAVGRGRAWLLEHPDQTFLSGAVLLLRRRALADIGPFDERFFLYAEEADWQRRALLRGWRVAVVEDVAAVHTGGGSSSDDVERARRVTRGALELTNKWERPLGRLAFRASALVAASRRWVVAGPEARRRERARMSVLLGRGSDGARP